jgi:hypothetical protein
MTVATPVAGSSHGVMAQVVQATLAGFSWGVGMGHGLRRTRQGLLGLWSRSCLTVIVIVTRR